MEFYRANRDVSALTNWRWWKIVDSHSWRAVLGKAWAGTPSGSTTKEFLPSPSSRRASHRMLPGQCVAVSMRLSTGQGPDLLDYSNFDQRCPAHMRWPTAAIAGIRDQAYGPNSTPLIAKRHKRCATSLATTVASAVLQSHWAAVRCWRCPLSTAPRGCSSHRAHPYRAGSTPPCWRSRRRRRAWSCCSTTGRCSCSH